MIKMFGGYTVDYAKNGGPHGTQTHSNNVNQSKHIEYRIYRKCEHTDATNDNIFLPLP